MYGLVNKAVRDLICANHGEEAWQQIAAAAGLELDSFVSMQSYDDDITYRLVAAASEHLGAPPREVLRAFGNYWTQFTLREGYRDLIESSGSSVEEFLDNLDALHARVETAFPQLRPPSFRLERSSEGALLLHYVSEREGLAPMVEGLLEGLGVHFDEEVEVEQLEHRAEHGHDVFRIRTRKRVAAST